MIDEQESSVLSLPTQIFMKGFDFNPNFLNVNLSQLSVKKQYKEAKNTLCKLETAKKLLKERSNFKKFTMKQFSNIDKYNLQSVVYYHISNRHREARASGGRFLGAANFCQILKG